jgi:hypothetical protein
MFKPLIFSKMMIPLKIAKPFLTGKTWALIQSPVDFQSAPYSQFSINY